MKNSAKSNTTMKLVPLGDRVLVQAYDVESHVKTKSGIYIPESVQKEKPEEGTIIAVGEGRYIDGTLVPLRVKVGDRIMFSKYGYDELKVDGKEYLIVKEDSILVIIK